MAKYAEVVAEKFAKGLPAQSPLSEIQSTIPVRGRRLVSTGDTLLSYGWWVVAERENERSVWVTDERYFKTNRRGKRHASPTTDMHIRECQYALSRAGYKETCFFGELGTLWEK
jgi:hypothetical protein